MPNIKQQKKRVRTAERERMENIRFRSTVKTLTKRLQAAVEAGDADAIAAEHRTLVRWVDQAATTGRAAREHRRPQEGAGGAARRRRLLVALALRLRPLRDDELPGYIEHGRAAYGHDLEAQAGLTADQARTKMEADWARLLPDGTVPDGNRLYVLEDENGERVGDLWWAERPNDFGERSAFVYNIEVWPEFRGKGYGKEAMALFEEDARTQGITSFGLMVLGGNDVARGLYRSIGYAERAVFMTKG